VFSRLRGPGHKKIRSTKSTPQWRYHFDVTILVRSPERNGDDADRLRARVTDLEAVLGERRGEVTRVQSELDVFEIDYRRRVGILHERLDQLELEIAEAELGELSKRLEGGSAGPARAFLILM
jgi:hypothetical protein